MELYRLPATTLARSFPGETPHRPSRFEKGKEMARTNIRSVSRTNFARGENPSRERDWPLASTEKKGRIERTAQPNARTDGRPTFR